MHRSLICSALALVAVSVAQATPPTPVTITVTPSLAPNAFGSPSWGGYQANALYAIAHGLSSYGDPTKPTYYSEAPTNLSVWDNVVTNFPDWRGDPNPAADYGPTFGAELGNRLTFGLDIKGNGQKISISDLNFSGVGDDPTGSLDFAFGGYNYNAAYVGVIYGPGGANTYITGGPSSQMVDEIVGRGSGNAWQALSGDPVDFPGSTPSDFLKDVPATYDLPSHFDFTGTYTLGRASGSATVEFSTPDTSSSALLMAGPVLLLFAGLRRRVADAR